MPYVITGIAASVLGVLCLINRRIGAGFTYPPALFSGWWALLLGAVAVSGESFYPLSTITLCIYVAGPFFFTLGGLIVVNRGEASPVPYATDEAASSVVSRVISAGIVVLVAALPAFYTYIARISASSGSRDFWYGVRAAMLRRGDRTVFDLKASLLDNLVTLSMLILFAAWMNMFTRQRWSRLLAGLALALSLTYNLMRAGNANTAAILLALMGMRWLRAGRVGRGFLVFSVVLFLVTFSAVSMLLYKGGTNAHWSVSDNLPALFELIQTYVLGGVVGFDRVAVDPSSIPPTWDIWRFFKLNANRLGAAFSVPSLHAANTMVSRTRATNVYTIYFAYYPEYGFFGVLVILTLLGAVATAIYLRARSRGTEATIFYGLVFSALVLSGHSEYFFLNLDFYLKCFVFTVLVYRLPAMFRRAKPDVAAGLSAGTPPPQLAGWHGPAGADYVGNQ
jgi:oligosaccharide repeat unit polymerase